MSNHSSLRAWSHRAAFTLVELLVVTSIVVLLISILLPSLQAARRQAKQAVCLSNLHNIAATSRVYATEDPQDWGIPVTASFTQQDPAAPSYIGAYEWGGKSGIGRADFLQPSLGSLSSKYGTMAGAGPASRPLNNLLYPGGFKDRSASFDRREALADTRMDLPVFRCPGDDGPPRGAHCADWVAVPERSSFDHYGNSYAANLFMVGGMAPGDNGVPVFGWQMYSNSPFLRPLSRVPTAPRTILYEENIGRWAWAAHRDACPHTGAIGVDPGPSKSIRGWHGRDWAYNRAFVDGHAENQRVYIEGTEDQDGYAEHYRLEQLDWYPIVEFAVGGGVVRWDSYG